METSDNQTNRYLTSSSNFTMYSYVDTNTDLMTAVGYLYCYGLPCIIWVGIVGNIMSFVVFMSTNLRCKSSSVYLAALSVTDIWFLLSLFVVWLEWAGVRLVHSEGWCQATVYITYVSAFLSIWLIVVITLENYIITHHLRIAQSLCTHWIAIMVVAVLVVFGMLLYGFSLWTSKVNEYRGINLCSPALEYMDLSKMFTYVDTIVTLVVPSFIILTVLISIFIKQVCKSHTRPSIYRQSARISRKEKFLLRISRLLLVLSVTFVALTLPSHAMKLRNLIISWSEVEPRGVTPLDYAVLQICHLFYYISFVSNVIVYCVFGRNYRATIVSIFEDLPCVKRCHYSPASAI